MGVFIRHAGQMAHFGSEFLATEGSPSGRAGVLRLAVSEQRIQVGGLAITCIDGQLST